MLIPHRSLHLCPSRAKMSLSALDRQQFYRRLPWLTPNYWVLVWNTPPCTLDGARLPCLTCFLTSLVRSGIWHVLPFVAYSWNRKPELWTNLDLLFKSVFHTKFSILPLPSSYFPGNVRMGFLFLPGVFLGEGRKKKCTPHSTVLQGVLKPS